MAGLLRDADLTGGLQGRIAETSEPRLAAPRPGQAVEALLRALAGDAAGRAEPHTDLRNTAEGGGSGEPSRQASQTGTLGISQDTYRLQDSSLNKQSGASTSQPQPPGSLAEPAGRFVRGAAITASGSDVQRIQVLLQDDRLGRIALRMVDRAGLIHAVVRTEGTQAAQLLTESLPALLESLSQRGLLASWTSAQDEGQQADARQGQPRRQRDGPGSNSGGRRSARSPAPVFQLAAS